MRRQLGIIAAALAGVVIGIAVSDTVVATEWPDAGLSSGATIAVSGAQFRLAVGDGSGGWADAGAGNTLNSGALAIGGNFTPTGQIRAADGTDADPSILWASDDDGSGTGFVRSAADEVGIVNNGDDGFTFSATRLLAFNRYLDIDTQALTSDVPGIQLETEWNAAGVTFEALVVNVENTASAANSQIFTYALGGTPLFTLDKDADFNFGAAATQAVLHFPNTTIGAEFRSSTAASGGTDTAFAFIAETNFTAAADNIMTWSDNGVTELMALQGNGILNVNGVLFNSGDLSLAAATFVRWNGRAGFSSPNADDIVLWDSALTNFGLLAFGGTGATDPAVKRGGNTQIDIVLANDSGFADIAFDEAIWDERSVDVSNPPTDAELDSEFGTPATVGAGFTGVIDDSNSSNVYFCYSDGSNWFTIAGTLAT